MTGCVLAAVLGMLAVVWYTIGGHLSDEEMEREVREQRAAASEAKGRGKFSGFFTKKK